MGTWRARRRRRVMGGHRDLRPVVGPMSGAGCCLVGGRSLVSFGRCLSVAMWRSEHETRPLAGTCFTRGRVDDLLNVLATRLVSSTAAAELGARDIHVRSAGGKRDQRPRGYASPISAPRRHAISPLPSTALTPTPATRVPPQP
jgi:hypothetical protein